MNCAFMMESWLFMSCFWCLLMQWNGFMNNLKSLGPTNSHLLSLSNVKSERPTNPHPL